MRPPSVRMRTGERHSRVKTLIACLVLAHGLVLGAVSAAEPAATPGPGAAHPAPAATDATYPTAATMAAPGPKLFTNQQLFAVYDRVQSILQQKNIPRDGSATPDQLADELTIVEMALANAADKTGEAAQAGYIMHASMEALCGRLNQADAELRLIIAHGSLQGRLAAYKELAEVLLQSGKAEALDELAARGEAEKIPQVLTDHMRMFANFLHIKLGEGFPTFAITDLAGAMHTLGDYQGHVLVLDFWASWCQPCMEALPALLKTYQRFHRAGVDILGVCLDDNPQNLQAIIRGSGMSWPQALETRSFSSPLLIKYGVWNLPANFVIAADGTLIAKNIHGDHLDQLLTKLLAQPDPAAAAAAAGLPSR